MNVRTRKGYVMAIASGVVLLGGVVLVLIQLNRVSEFSLYWYRYDMLVVEGKIRGGVNTALLMLLSGAGGVLAFLLVRVFISGVRSLRKGQRQEAQRQATRRLSELEKARTEPPKTQDP